jgi:hypothetical protein
MSKSLYLSITIALPDDAFEAAALTVQIGAPWQDLLAALQAANVKHIKSCEMTEVRTKPAPGAKRGRKPRGAIKSVADFEAWRDENAAQSEVLI